jgi:hypothetical protein
VAFQLRDDKQVELTVEALDAEDNPAAATTTFASSDESIVSLRDNGDGTAIAIASPGAAGLGTATVTATVTQQSSGDTLEGTFDIEVVAGDAVTVNVVAGHARAEGRDRDDPRRRVGHKEPAAPARAPPVRQ